MAYFEGEQETLRSVKWHYNRWYWYYIYTIEKHDNGMTHCHARPLVYDWVYGH